MTNGTWRTRIKQGNVDFANALCLEKVDIAKLHCVAEGSAKP